MIAALAALLLATGPSTAAETAFLAKNAKAPGVVALPGLQYQVLASGPADGPHPKNSDTVVVRYKGSLIDGTVFDQTEGDATASFGVRQVIAGFSSALKMMRPGDKWRIFIPAYLAYGPAAKPTIPADSPLVFELELVSIGG